MSRLDALDRLTLRTIPILLLAGLGISAAIAWYAATAPGEAAGLQIFVALALTTLAMTGLLAWTLRRAARETARAEAAMREASDSSARFRELLELSSDWYWEQDAGLRFTALSGGVERKGALRLESVVGRTRWELPIEGLSEADWAAHRACLDRREPFHDLRYRIRAEDGSLRTFLTSGRPVFAADGAFLGYRGTGRDITAAAEAEEALRRSERQLRLIAENMPAMFASFRPGRICEYANTRYAGFFGFTPEQIVGRHLRDIIGRTAHDGLEHYWVRVESGETLNYQRGIDAPGGRTMHIDVWLVPQANVRSGPRGVHAMVYDITAHKEAELKQRLAASVFENSLEGVAITDAARNIVSVNRAFTRITGYAADEAMGKNPRFLSSGRQDAAFYADMWQAIQRDGSWSGEIWNRRKNGEVYPELLSITCIGDEAGRPLHYVGIFTDITELKRAEEEIRAMNAGLERRVRERTAELEASNRELEAFSYSVSHDLRGPLRGIEGFAHVIGEDYADCLGAAGRDHLERIRQAAKRMSQTIDDLLELARISRAEMHRREVDLSALAHACAGDLREASPRAAQLSIAPGLQATADPTLVASLVGILLDNAWKFTARQPEPRIAFGAEKRAGETVFFVRDNGAGFDMAYADKLFQPFQRLHRPDEFPGAGIGLATAARIVRRHGGRIWAEGAPGQGATFWFTLP